MPEPDPSANGSSLTDNEARLDVSTLAAFFVAALFAGGNAVAVKLGLGELAPFWGAAVRFLAAAMLLTGALLVMRLALPGGRALVGVLIYGTLNFGLFYMFLYWALQEVTAATAMVILAIVPLLTLVLAVVQRVEQFNTRGLIGALIAALGIAIVFGDRVGAVSVLSLVAVFGGALCAAEVGIVIKQFPRVHPVVANAVGMGTGGAELLIVSAVAAEPWVVPTTPAVQISLVYLVLLGSIGLFILFLFVLGRWTASATSYVLLLAPLAAAVLGLIVLNEPVSPGLIVGGVVAVLGVYVGAITRGHPTGPTVPTAAVTRGCS